MSADPSLPRGWAHATIGDLVSQAGVFCDGDWVESEDQDPDGDVRLIQLADVGDGEYRDRSSRFLTSEKAEELNCTILEPGDVLIARMPDPLGRACIFPGDAKQAVTVVDVCVVRTGVCEIDHRWLQWFINAPRFRVQVAGLQSGSTRKRISRGNLSTLTLPVPPSAEQRRIVAKIEELFSDLDSGVAALERVRLNLKRYRAAVLKAAVEGRLTKEWRNQNPATEPAAELLERILTERRAKWEQDQLRKFKEAGKMVPKGWKEKYETPLAPSFHEAGTIPQTWCVASIDQLSHFVTSGSRGWAEHYSDDGPVFIRAQDINSDRLRLDQVAHVHPPAGAEVARTRTAIGDLLVTVTGANVTKTGFVEQELGDAYVSQHVAMVRLVLPAGVRYVHTWVICPAHGRRTLEKLAYGAGKPGLNLEQVRSLSVFLPPFAEQAEIVTEVDRRLSVADAAEIQVEHALQRAARLRQAILKRAFEGKLVPQDATDEPASLILNRIRAASERVEETALHTRRQSAFTPRKTKESFCSTEGLPSGQ